MFSFPRLTDHRPFYVHFRQCYILHKMHLMQEGLYIGEIASRLSDRFREHLRDVKRNDKDVSKPVARYFNLPNYSTQNMTICGLSMHQGNTDSRKNLEQKFIFQLGSLNTNGINERFSFV